MDEKFCPHCMKMVSITDSTCKHCQKLIDYQSKSYHLRVGTKLNKRYLIGSSLGEGGFGITYIAYDTVLALRVAIKEYYPLKKVTRNNKQTNLLKTITEADDKYFVKGKERFLEEARVLARFTFEPNIVEVRDFFEENNTAYIVMEYIDGMSLKAYIEKKES